MNYEEFRSRDSFARDELLAFAAGALVDDGPELFGARLPLPPMLMLDRITAIRTRGSRGRIEAERDVAPDDWFFACHFDGDPVQPGCLGVDAVWQLLGFYCAWRGGLGAGRALGCGQIAFDGQIRPEDKVVRYEVDVRRCTIVSGATLAIADAVVLVDGRPVYTLKDARVGLFPDLVLERRAASTKEAGASVGTGAGAASPDARVASSTAGISSNGASADAASFEARTRQAGAEQPL